LFDIGHVIAVGYSNVADIAANLMLTEAQFTKRRGSVPMRVKPAFAGREKFVMKRIVVGISGATGAPLAVRVLEFLRDLDVEVHLVAQWARATLLLECGIRAKDLTRYAHQMHDASDQAATISSGSFHTDGARKKY
jgi:hypothetical protein